MTATGTTGKWIFRLLTIAVVGAFIAFAVGNRLMPDHRAEAFVANWAGQFHNCPDIDGIRALPLAERPDCIYIRQFTNGQWVAVRSEHSCCSGAGFDASVFSDSARTIRYDTTYSFCGYEGLCGELGRVQATDLAGFYAALTNLTLRNWEAK